MKVNSVSSAAVLLSTTVSAFGFGKPPPAPEVHLVEGFPWRNPFKSDAINAFEPTCQTKVNFNAMEYTLHDLMKPPPEGLKPWGSGLKKVFSGREYPGGWTGLDRHLHDRSLLMLDYHKLPLAVRLWVEDQERSATQDKGLFAVFEKPKQDDDIVGDVVEFPAADKIDRSQDESKVAIFAPGAVYGILPLWAAEESNCKDDLLDLAKYKPTPEDGGVVAWMEHTAAEDNAMIFQVQVQKVKAREGDASSSSASSETTGTASKDEL